MEFSRLFEAIKDELDGATTVIGFTILVFLYVFNIYRKRNASRLPPGPSPWPIIGNLHQLGRLPHRSLEGFAKKNGPVMYLKLGYFPAVVVSSAEMAKEFLKTHDLTFATRPASSAGKHLAYNYKDLAFVPYGAYWRHVRKICVTELLSAKRLESFRPVREEEVSAAIRKIWEKSEQGRVAVNVTKVLGSLTSSVMWRIIAGTKYSEDDVAGHGNELGDMMKEVLGTILAFNIGDFIPYLDWLDLQGIRRRMKKAHKFFDRVVQRLIDEHVNNRRMDQASNVKDFVDVLLDMAESDTLNIKAENIKALIFVLLVAGTDTTASCLEWAMSEMVRNPHIARKLQEEIESIVGKDRLVRESDLRNMEYLRCVVKESLRLYPPGPLMLPHESTKSCNVGTQGFYIPEKTRLIVNVMAIGRDPAIWEDPLAFKPERFMVKDIDIKGQEMEMLMIPFGAGRRGCPGALMATGSMELMLAQLMHCFDWRVEGDPSKLDMSEAFQTSIARKESLFATPTLKISNCI